MPILDKFLSLFKRETLESSPIVSLSSTTLGDTLPHGFFISIGASGAVSLGFYCPKCGFNTPHSAECGVVHCGRREKAPDAAQWEHLEKVKWDFPRAGEVRLPNGGRVIDVSEGDFNGEFGYETSDYGTGSGWR